MERGLPTSAGPPYSSASSSGPQNRQIPGPGQKPAQNMLTLGLGMGTRSRNSLVPLFSKCPEVDRNWVRSVVCYKKTSCEQEQQGKVLKNAVEKKNKEEEATGDPVRCSSTISFWLHCNLCCWQQPPANPPVSSSSKPGASGTESQRAGHFVLASCGHVFCGNCATAGLTSSCLLCGRQQVKMMAIEATPSAELFQPPPHTLHTLSGALNFQIRQGVNLDRVLRKQVETAVKAIGVMQEKIGHLAKELQMVQNENQQLKDAMAKLKRKAVAQHQLNISDLKLHIELDNLSQSMHEKSFLCMKTPALLKNTETEDIRRAINGISGLQGMKKKGKC